MKASGVSTPPPPPGPRLTALAAAELVALIEKSGGGAITEADLAAAVDVGAPVNPDATFNFVNFAAWLASQGS